MLHPAHHFLADIAALLEVDAAQQVHADIVREHAVGREIGTLLRHPAGNPRRGIGIVGCSPVAPVRGVADHHCVRRVSGPADPVCFPQVRDLDGGPELVHPHALEERIGDALIDIEPERVIGVATEAFRLNLALRRQQRPPDVGTRLGDDPAGHDVEQQLLGIRPRKSEQGA